MSGTPSGWQGILERGERILWQGRPGRGMKLREGDLPESLFGLGFTAVPVLWLVNAGGDGFGRLGTPGVFLLVAPLFLAIGLYKTVLKYPWRVFLRRNTFYTLTNRRGIIATDPLGMKELKSYPITPQIELEPGRRGDDIWFAREKLGSRRNSPVRKIGFEQIENGRKVIALARAALAERETQDKEITP